MAYMLLALNYARLPMPGTRATRRALITKRAGAVHANIREGKVLQYIVDSVV
jgi:hypothetical protein